MIGFFEAFPELSVDDKMYDMFAGVQVEKVNASKTKMLALIHCTSDQLLHYRTLKNMEYKLYRQIFRSIGVNLLYYLLCLYKVYKFKIIALGDS